MTKGVLSFFLLFATAVGFGSIPTDEINNPNEPYKDMTCAWEGREVSAGARLLCLSVIV